MPLMHALTGRVVAALSLAATMSAGAVAPPGLPQLVGLTRVHLQTELTALTWDSTDALDAGVWFESGEILKEAGLTVTSDGTPILSLSADVDCNQRVDHTDWCAFTVTARLSDPVSVVAPAAGGPRASPRETLATTWWREVTRVSVYDDLAAVIQREALALVRQFVADVAEANGRSAEVPRPVPLLPVVDARPHVADALMRRRRCPETGTCTAGEGFR